jgi:hypothetical protein
MNETYPGTTAQELSFDLDASLSRVVLRRVHQ